MDKRLLDAKVIIFDIGNVLIKFDMEFIAKMMLPEDLIYITKEDFFNEQWLLLDEGLTTSEIAAQKICSHFKVEGNEKKFISLMNDFYTYCIPLTPSIWLKDLKKQGKRIFLLTNYADKSFDNTKEYFDFFKFADGEIVSAKVNLCKPDKRIYTTLLDKYSIKPSEAVFLDDRKENVDAAAKLGITAIHYPFGLKN